MSTDELLEELKKLNNQERLAVIEAATHMIRLDLQSRPTPPDAASDPLLRVAGCLSGAPVSSAEIDGELYGRSTP